MQAGLTLLGQEVATLYLLSLTLQAISFGIKLLVEQVWKSPIQYKIHQTRVSLLQFSLIRLVPAIMITCL